MDKVLTAILTTVYKMDETEVADLLKETDEQKITDAILAKDRERVSNFTKEKTEAFNKGHKKAQKEVLVDFENKLRTTYEIDDPELKGEDLISKIVEIKTSDLKTKGKLSDDEIKKHPLYVQLEQEKAKAVKATEAEWKTKLENKESEIKKRNSSFKGQKTRC